LATFRSRESVDPPSMKLTVALGLAPATVAVNVTD
jgi:hypothetical protein